MVKSPVVIDLAYRQRAEIQRPHVVRSPVVTELIHITSVEINKFVLTCNIIYLILEIQKKKTNINKIT